MQYASDQKICVFPCNGLFHPCGEISRSAVYDAVNKIEHTVLGCLPATAVGVQEDIEFIIKYPVVAVEGCHKKCIEKVLAKRGAKPLCSVVVKEILDLKGLKISNELKDWSLPDLKKIELVSNHVSGCVHKLLMN